MFYYFCNVKCYCFLILLNLDIKVYSLVINITILISKCFFIYSSELVGFIFTLLFDSEYVNYL
jgi:hypothetical protein